MRLRFRHIVGTVIGLMALAAVPVAVLAPGIAPLSLEPSGDPLRDALAAAVRCEGVPGMILSLRDGSAPPVALAAGHADRRGRRPMDPEAPVQVGSVTKLFTATVILKLAEAGQIDLDAPLADWFPAYPNAALITLRQMLMHRSGLGEMLETQAARRMMGWPWGSPDPHPLAEDLAEMPARAEPGGDYDYSNTNYLLLGFISETVSGKPLQDLYRELIFAPLNTQGAWLAGRETAEGAPPNSYDRDLIAPFGLLPVTPGMIAFVSLAHGAGGLMMPVPELRAAVDGIMAGRVIGPPSLAATRTAGPAPQEGVPGRVAYGLGLAEYDLGGARWYGHSGLTIGFTTVVLWRADGGRSLALSCNRSNCDVWGTAVALLDVIDRPGTPVPCPLPAPKGAIP
jgi:D-alanyl-D-alanine carboxypeptidase